MDPTRLERLTAAELPISLGRYELQHVQGEGGMARVFRAELIGPAGFRKPVALKILKASAGGVVKSDEINDLVREARLGGRLKHPNIVDVYELVEIEGQLFIAMELVDGLTLSGLIRARRVLPAPVVLQLAVAITAGLAKAHSLVSQECPSGLVHCDIKPSNILISWDGDVKLADFGIATIQSSAVIRKNGKRFVRGTLEYMSPEQLYGEVLDGRSDLFSWALVIGCMALGRHPINNMTLQERLLEMDSDTGSILPTGARKEIDAAVPGLGDILERCLSIERHFRPTNASALYQSLVQLQEHIGHRPTLLNWLTDPARGEQPATLELPKESSSKEMANSEITDPDDPETVVRSNLGPSGDFFVGRVDEFVQLRQLVNEGARLITIKGPGGAGKTRLSRKFARSVLLEFKGGVWFADLTESRSYVGTLKVVATALNVPLTGGDEEEQLTQQLGHAIADRQCLLLVLDNCEQVIEHVARMVSCWLEVAPEVVLLTTSRERLSVVGEHIFALGPLPTKDGVTLFRTRARAVGSVWSEAEDTTGIIEQIVEAIDGLPLAIELAAARARLMSPHQILERLNERFKLLRGNARDRSSRQATLRGLIDWSWDLLEPWERSALAQLSVFRDGFFMDAAEKVLDLSAFPDAPWSIDVVGSLLDKSLLHSKASLDQPRFDMYVSIHAYAKEKLAQMEDGGFERAAQKRHAAHYAVLGLQDTQPGGQTGPLRVRLPILHRELENLLAGIEYGAIDSAPMCCLAAIRVLGMTGPITAAIDMAGRVLDLPELPPRIRMLIEIQRSKCLRISGRTHEARLMVRDAGRQTTTRKVPLISDRVGTTDKKIRTVPEETAAHPEDTEEGKNPEMMQAAALVESGNTEHTVNDNSGVAKANHTLQDGLSDGVSEVSQRSREQALMEAERLMELGNVEREQSQETAAIRAYQAARELYKAHGHRSGEGCALGNIGVAHQERGEYARAIPFFTEALTIAQETNDRLKVALHIGNLGIAHQSLGQQEKAIASFIQAIEIAEEVGDTRHKGTILGNLGVLYGERGEHARAIPLFEEALDIAREVGEKRFEGLHLCNLGLVHQNLGQHQRAHDYFTEALGIAREINARLHEGIYLGNLGDSLFMLERLDEAETKFRSAIPILDETFPIAAGAFRGSLAQLLAQQDRLEEICTLLETGESQVKAHEVEHVKFLSKKGQACHHAGDFEGARSSLKKAKTLVARLNVNKESEASKGIRALEAVLSGTSEEDTVEDRDLALTEAKRLMELGNVERSQGLFDAAVSCYQRAIKLFQQHGDRAGQGEVLALLGSICSQKGEVDRAIELYAQSIDIAREVGDKGNEGEIHCDLGVIYHDKGELCRAVEHFTQALDIARELSNVRHTGITLGNLANVYQTKGELGQAAEYLTQAIDISREIGNKPSESIHLSNLGLVYQYKGELDRAVTLYTQALDIAREIGAKHIEGVLIGNLGDTQFQQNRFEEAEANFREAIPLCDEVNPLAAGAFRASLALLLAQQGRLPESQALLESGESQVAIYPDEHAKFLAKKSRVQHLAGDTDGARASLMAAKQIAATLTITDNSEVGQAIQVLEQVLLDDSQEVSEHDRDLRVIEAERQAELGNVERVQCNYDAAIQHYRSALEIFKRHGHRAGEARVTGCLGLIHRLLSQHEQAIHCHTEAVAIAQELNDKRGEGIHLGNLALVYRDQSLYEQAIQMCRRSSETAREMGDRSSEGSQLELLGSIYQSRGQHEQAIQVFHQTIAISRTVGAKSREANQVGALGTVYLAQGRYELAIQSLSEAINLAQDVGDKYVECIHLGNFGDALFKLGRLDEAEDAFRQAIPIGDKTWQVAAGAFRGSLARLIAQQNRHDEALALLEVGESQVSIYPEEHAKFLSKKGQVQILVGDADGARETLVRTQQLVSTLNVGVASEISLAIQELEAMLQEGSLGTSDEQRELALVEAERLIELGHVERTQSNYVEAKECFHGAIDLFRQHGALAGEGRAMGSLGTVYRMLGQNEQATQAMTQAIDIAKQLGDRQSEAIHLANLALVQIEQGLYERAINIITQCIDMARELGQRRTEGIQLGNLGTAYNALGQYDYAIEYLTQGIDIAREVGDKRNEGIHTGTLGTVYHALGQYERATQHFTEAVDMTREVGDRIRQGVHLGNLGDTLFKQARIQEAEHSLRQSIAMCEEIYSTAAGAFRGSLAWLLAQQGQAEESLSLLETGEPQVASEPSEYAKFLIKKALVLQLVGQLDQARAASTLAQDIASGLSVKEQSDFKESIAAFEDKLNEYPETSQAKPDKRQEATAGEDEETVLVPCLEPRATSEE